MSYQLFPSALCRMSSRRFMSVLILIVMCGVLVENVWSQTQKRQVPVESLIYDLKNPDPVRRREAATLLGDNKVQRATPDLVAAASDSDASVRREVVVALDKMLDMRALPAFINLSNDPEKDIREKCIQSALRLYLPQESGLTATATKVANFFNPWSDEWADTVIGPGIKVDQALIGALQSRLQDPEEGIRVKAARALGILKAKQSLSALLEDIQLDKSNAVRFEIVRALRKIGNPTAGKNLMSFISYDDFKVRNEAVYTLGRFKYQPASGELLRLYEKEAALPAKLIDKTYRECLLDALAFIADPASKQLFLKEMGNANATIRLHALEGLARIADASMVSDISRARLTEKDPKILTAEAYALYRMGRKEYLQEIVKALGNGKTNYEARQYLVEFSREELPALYAESKSNEVAVREGLAEVYGLIGDASAIPVLQELSNDHRGRIAALANEAIRSINARAAN
jgi:HEAT repeat protein